MKKVTFRFILSIFAAFASAAIVSAEVIKLECKLTDPERSDWPASELYFNTYTKSAALGAWPMTPVMTWTDDFIIWAVVSKDPQLKNLAALFSFNRKSDLLIIETISEDDFSEYNQKYGGAYVNFPRSCRRDRSF